MELIFWGVLFIVFILVEAAATQLVAVWFAVGSLAAFIASMFDAPILAQMVTFVAVSTVLLFFTRPILKKVIVKKVTPTNADSIIGKKGIVIQSIDDVLGTGRVKVDGLDWSAKSVDGENIDENALIKVIKIEGVKVWVEKA